LKIAMLSAPGREATTWGTIAALERQNPGVAFWIFRSPLRPSVGDFWSMLRAFGGDDVLFLEDDITSARNFFRYAEAWRAPHVTSFFHTRRPVLGVPVDGADFSFAQAVKVPGALLDRLSAAPRRGQGHDDDLGCALHAIGEKVIYHRSLVQHTGTLSLAWGPDRTLDHRVASDFVGEDYDCLPEQIGQVVAHAP
jgi:hypothetical protein